MLRLLLVNFLRVGIIFGVWMDAFINIMVQVKKEVELSDLCGLLMVLERQSWMLAY